MRTARFFFCIAFASVIALAQNPVPFLNQPLVPDATVPGGPSFTLTVNGTGFVSGATVNWNGTALATTFVSSSQLTAPVPASNIAKATTVPVTVTNPAPGGGVSNTQFFSVVSPTPTAAFSQTEAPNLVGPVIAVGDFNKDGKLDVVESGLLLGDFGGQGMCLLLGGGSGSFGAPQCFGGGASPALLAVGDFDGDGNLDVAGASILPNSIGIALGNGDGTFQEWHEFATPTAAIISSFFAADFNHDGKLDLALVQFDAQPSTTITVYPGNGDGTFGTPKVSTFTEEFSTGVTVGDFNGDGILDLAGLYFVGLGNGDGTFQQPQTFSGPPLFGATAPHAADVNGDGKLDLIAAIQSVSGRPWDIAVFPGNGDGTFQPAILSQTANTPSFLGIGDVNGDGEIDAVAVANTADASAISILLGNGDGSFQSPVLLGANPAPQALAMGDLNNDGKMDLVGPPSVFLQGAYPGAKVSPASLTFSAQTVGTASASKQVTLMSIGLGALAVSKVSITGANAGDFAETNNCPSSLAPGSSCQISVTFSPTTSGNRAAVLSISDNAAGGPQNVPLSGTGLNLNLEVPSGGTNSATVSAGGTTIYFLQIGGGGLDGTATLACAGTPATVTCSLPPTVNVSASTASNFQISVTTTAPATALVHPAKQWMWALALIGIVLVPGTKKLRFKRRTLLWLPLLLAMFLPSCGGSSKTFNSGGTPAGTYDLTVTANMGSAKESQTLKLIVQ